MKLNRWVICYIFTKCHTHYPLLEILVYVKQSICLEEQPIIIQKKH